MAQQIATTLRNDNHGDADFSYEALKAYQMLYLPKQYDGKFLRARVMLNLQRNLPQGSTQKQLQQIEWHLSQLLDTQIRASPYAKDEQWVAQAQAAINRAPLSQRVYGRLKRLLLKQTDIKPVSRSIWPARKPSWRSAAKAANRSPTVCRACSPHKGTGKRSVTTSTR